MLYISSPACLVDTAYVKSLWLEKTFSHFLWSRCLHKRILLVPDENAKCCFSQASLSFTAMLLIASHSLYLRRKSADLDGDGEAPAAPANVPLMRVLRDHWRGLLGAGLYCAMLNGIRNTWMVALPLRGHHIGLSKLGIGASVAWYRACDATVTTIAAGWENLDIPPVSTSRFSNKELKSPNIHG